jgi:glutamine synthetase
MESSTKSNHLPPVDKDLYELEGAEAAAIPQVPGSLDAVLDSLEKDHEFLTEGWRLLRRSHRNMD